VILWRGQVKVTLNFSRRISYFIFHVLVVDIETFQKLVINLLFIKIYIQYINRVSETTRTPFLSRKQSILEKNVSNKSCGVLNDPFSYLII